MSVTEAMSWVMVLLSWRRAFARAALCWPVVARSGSLEYHSVSNPLCPVSESFA